MRRLPLVIASLVLLVTGCGPGFSGDGTTSSGETLAGGEAGEGADTDTDFNEYCSPQVEWDAEAAAFEAEVLEIVNQRRSEGATCGGQDYAPTGPMALDVQLRCAARIHSLDMFVRDFFAHDNPDGESPWDRVAKTDYSANPTGENIAQGYPTPVDVMQGWMDSPGHCQNIMNPDSNEIGIGYYDSYWTQVMGRR